MVKTLLDAIKSLFIYEVIPMKWIRGNLVRRLVGPPLVLSIVAVILVGSLAYFSVRSALIDSAYDRLNGSLDLHGAELARWVTDQKQYVVFLSRTPFFRDHVADLLSYKSNHLYYQEGYRALSEFVFSYIKIIPGVREVMILSGGDGKILISTHRENEGSSRAEYPFFAKGKKDVFVEGVHSWKGADDPIISVVKPLRDSLGMYRGVLAVHLDLERMAQVVFGHSGLGDTGESYIVDRQNRLISSQQSGRPGFSTKAHSRGIRQAIKGRQGVSLYENYSGVPVVGAYRWLPDLEVALLAEVSQEEVFAPARKFGWIIIGIGTLLSGLLLVGNLAAARRIARPLLDLSRAASRVSSGDLSAKVKVRNDDEIGVLAEAFNGMVVRLGGLYSELQTNAIYFSTVFQLSPNAVAVVNYETAVIVEANESFGKLFGIQPEKAIGRSVVELGIWGSETERLQLRAELQKQAVLSGREVTFNRRDGDTFEGMLSARLIELNGVQHVIAVVWDISERLRVKEELRNSNERLQLLIDRMPIGCIVWNPMFEVDLWNPAAEEIFGFSSAEACGRHANDLIVPEVARSQVEVIYQRLLAGDSTAHSQNANLTKTGETIFCDWYNTPLHDQAGDAIGTISMVRDISDSKKTEEELERYRLHLEELVSERTQQLEEAQSELVEKERLAVLGQLTATVSHELRNPLGTVSNAIFSIKDALKKEQMERLEKALTLADRNVHRCDGIISELLDFTRNHDLVKGECDIGPWLEGVLKDQRINKEIDLTCDLPAGFVVSADVERLRRAFINVFENSIQALCDVPERDGHIYVALKREQGRIGIDIVDNGIGISEDVMKRIFEPLFSTKGFGIGLGMSIVRNIIEEHGGDVAVCNVSGGGTKVTLWLPAK